MTDLSSLTGAVFAGDRRALAKAITLLESRRPEDENLARELLDAVVPRSGKSLRIGLSGAPGVGKSTLIESLGLHLIAQGHRVAVLAVDPSSSVSGGSILGDKTRMDRLSVHPAAFIRPTPSAGSLGGVAARSREVALLCEAAGYDRIIIETVGVGQSETAVATMTDIFVVLQLPNAGDELQGIKKGLLELADIVAVNKSDLDGEAAERAAQQLRNALMMVRAKHSAGSTPVLLASALRESGIAELAAEIESLAERLGKSGEFADNRRRQALAWMQQQIDAGLAQRFATQPGMSEALAATRRAVQSGALSASAAAARLLERFDKGRH
jgi:LAO/AO transport system kinase